VTGLCLQNFSHVSERNYSLISLDIILYRGWTAIPYYILYILKLKFTVSIDEVRIDMGEAM